MCAVIAAFVASFVLSGVQMASYTAFTTSGARVGDPGNNLVGPGDPLKAQIAVPDATQAWPVEIRLLKDRRTLVVSFDDGVEFSLPAELLRVTSPSAEVQGHSEAQRKTVGGKRNVTILSVDAVGNYRSGSASTICTPPVSIPGLFCATSASTRSGAFRTISTSSRPRVSTATDPACAEGFLFI